MAYDAKAVKVPKSVKRVAAYIMDKHARGAFIRQHVRVLESEAHTRVARNRGHREE